MNRRTIRNILSGTLLGAYGLLAAGTTEQPLKLEPQLRHAEYPLQLYVHGTEAFVLDRYDVGIGQRQRFTRITLDGKVTLLNDGPLSTSPGRWKISSVVTGGTEGILAFALASTTAEGSLAVSVTPSGNALTIPVDRGGLYFSPDDVSQLALIERDASRQWVFMDSASLTMDDSFLPLFEISNTAIHLLANNVLWAGCQENLCRQVRVENFRLRLYSNSEMEPEYFTVITEATYTPGMAHYNCADPTGNPAVAFGDTVYSISMTAPTLMPTSRLLATGVCSVPPPIDAVTEDYAVDSENWSLSGTFANGARISIVRYAEVSPGNETYEMRLGVNIYQGNQTWLSFPLHAR